jgi:hypothetical protein
VLKIADTEGPLFLGAPDGPAVSLLELPYSVED